MQNSSIPLFSTPANTQRIFAANLEPEVRLSARKERLCAPTERRAFRAYMTNGDDPTEMATVNADGTIVRRQTLHGRRRGIGGERKVVRDPIIPSSAPGPSVGHVKQSDAKYIAYQQTRAYTLKATRSAFERVHEDHPVDAGAVLMQPSRTRAMEEGCLDAVQVHRDDHEQGHGRVERGRSRVRGAARRLVRSVSRAARVVHDEMVAAGAGGDARTGLWTRTQSLGGRARRRLRRTETSDTVVKHAEAVAESYNFILKLAQGLLAFGAPSHRIESQLSSVARFLKVPASFLHLPSVILVSFGDEVERSSKVKVVAAPTKLALGKLHSLHLIYRQVVHDELGVTEATAQVSKLLSAPPIYGLRLRCLVAFLCSAIISPMSFGGSVLDMCISGLGGALLCFLQLGVAKQHPMYAKLFEISVAVIMAFIARGLSSIAGNLFCYQAISSAGIVLILPGHIILASALELGTKNMLCGSVRMVYAVIYALFLGFGLTIGSDLYLVLDPHARKLQDTATQALIPVMMNGTFTPNDLIDGTLTGLFSFTNSTPTGIHTVAGCVRNDAWPWYRQNFPFWTLFFLVPIYCTSSSLWKLQPIKSKQLPIMVFFACCSYAANKLAKNILPNRGDVTSAVGALVIGILGNLYSRLFKGTAFTAMVVGVSFLVPSSLAAAGGLSMNYRGDQNELYANGLMLGMKMVQIAIGVTVGLFGSALIVYSFGTRKKTGLFGF